MTATLEKGAPANYLTAAIAFWQRACSDIVDTWLVELRSTIRTLNSNEAAERTSYWYRYVGGLLENMNGMQKIADIYLDGDAARKLEDKRSTLINKAAFCIEASHQLVLVLCELEELDEKRISELRESERYFEEVLAA